MRIGNLTSFEGFVISKDVSAEDKIKGLDPVYVVENLTGSLILRSLDKGFSLYALDIDKNGITRRLIKENIEGDSLELNVSELHDSRSAPSFLKLTYLVLSNGRRIVRASAVYMLNKLEEPFPLTMPDVNHSRSKRWLTTISDAYCKVWKATQRDPQPYMDALPPCWPSVPFTRDGNFPENFGEFEIDGSCNPKNPENCATFHPGSASCYRSETSKAAQVAVTAAVVRPALISIKTLPIALYLAPVLPRQQCCYSPQNRLLVGPPGVNFTKHFLW